MPELLIDSLDDPRLAPYRDLTKRNPARWSGRFIAEGRLVVERLVASRYPVESVLLSRRRRDLVAPRLPPDTPVYVVPDKTAARLVGYNFHAGVLACGRRLPGPALAELAAAAGPSAVLVAAHRMVSPENLGALLRVSAAFSACGVLLGPGCADPFSRRVLRVSMGQAFRLPLVERRDLGQALDELREAGFELAAAVARPDATPLPAASRPERLAVLLGNEADGLPPELERRCRQRLTIPMAPGADSLNVAVAAAVILYHFAAGGPRDAGRLAAEGRAESRPQQKHRQ